MKPLGVGLKDIACKEGILLHFDRAYINLRSFIQFTYTIFKSGSHQHCPFGIWKCRNGKEVLKVEMANY